MSTFTYRRGAERPNLTFPWQEETSSGVWANLDLSTGYTFTLTLTAFVDGDVTTINSDRVAGADGSVTIAWQAGDLDITVGTYALNLRATTGGLDRDHSPANPVTLVIKP